MATRRSVQCWVWCPVDSSRDFVHPADVPFGDTAAAKAAFLERMRGPRLARISPAMMLPMTGDLKTIAQKGATRQVPSWMVLPWSEGLLILDELEQVQGQLGHLQAGWYDDELRGILLKEQRRVTSAQYTEKRLNIASTGPKSTYRRMTTTANDKSDIVGGESTGAIFKMREIIGYMPPWEAFHDEKCGFYQDFYQVRWDHPFSEVDYAAVENGSTDEKGATWEPDECLPDHMDPLRLEAKKNWVKACQKVQERNQGVKRKPVAASQGAPADASPAPGDVVVKKERPDEVPVPPAKMAKRGRDGSPLVPGLLHSRIGHDFAPESVEQASLRCGWPKRAEDYPPGFDVASPPGFCQDTCDCMDGGRPQKPEEVRKAWLEEARRDAAALGAIEMFSAHTGFVARCGQPLQPFCFFKSRKGMFTDQKHAKAAAELAASVEVALRVAVEQIPISSLLEADPVRIPALAFLIAGDNEDNDYEPLVFNTASRPEAPLPNWISINPDNGQISMIRRPTASELPSQLRIDCDLFAAEGVVGRASVGIVAQKFAGSAAPWLNATASSVEKYAHSLLERGVWVGLHRHFEAVYDFGQQRARQEVRLGAWLEVMTRILRLLRSASGAKLELGIPTR